MSTTALPPKMDVLSIFPEAFESPLRLSLLGKAIANGLIEVGIHDLREYADLPHRKVDDEPFGGGAGMVMGPKVIVEAVEKLATKGARVILLTAGGRPYRQKDAEELSQTPHTILICGRYEGIDARVPEILGAEEISVGQFVLAGGEVAALMVIESVVRLLPGVMGNESSGVEESFTSGLIEYPQYTRPAEFRGAKVPEVLLSGDHKKIDEWRRTTALRRTFELRPEMLDEAELSDEESQLVGKWAEERLSSEGPQPT